MLDVVAGSCQRCVYTARESAIVYEPVTVNT